MTDPKTAPPVPDREQSLLPRASGRAAAAELLRLAKPWAGSGVLAVLSLLLASLATLAVPLGVGVMVDVVTGNRPQEAMFWALGALLGAAALGGVCTWLGGTFVARFSEGALARLRQKVIGHLMRIRLVRIERAGLGDVVSRVSADVERVSSAAKSGVTQFVSATLTIVLTLFGLAALDYRFALAGLVAVPLQLWTLWRYLKKSAPIYAEQRVAEGARAQEILQSQYGRSTIDAFGVAEVFLGRIGASSRRTVDLERSVVRVLTVFFGRLNAAEFVGLGCILATGFWLYSVGEVSLGACSAAALFFAQLFNPINLALGLFDVVQQAGSALTRLVGVLSVPIAETPQRPVPGAAPVGPVAAKAISVRDLVVSYRPGHPVLHAVSTEIGIGEHVAVVGSSGAGKSTLGSAINGDREAESGQILIGGVPLSDLAPDELRSSVASVSQKTHVFSGTLAEDLRLVKPRAGDEELHAALREVGAGPWVAELPAGLATLVGAGGQQLSAVQEQQLALARIALIDPGIVVLDEATAEDTANSRSLEQAAGRLIAGKTAVVIAHRLSQAAAADRIIVMAEGRIVQDGTHEELLAEPGRYRGLWDAWTASGVESA
ncbi:MAG: ABC transporter ATP-binding protein [Renibacterium sp.]|nr:ABC transporter ATP-binding protein [Renibacterium sp.]